MAQKAKDKALIIVGKDFDKSKTITVNEDNIDGYILPSCCRPIPGDNILAYVNKHNQIEIHQRSCSEAQRLQSSFGTNIVPAKWDMAGSLTFKASIEMRGIDRKGMTKDVSTVIYDAFDVNIKSFMMTTDDGIFNCRIELLVTDNVITERIIKKLYAINGMQSVHRM